MVSIVPYFWTLLNKIDFVSLSRPAKLYSHELYAKTLYILDGNALLHRAWHAVPPLTTQEGLIVNAVYGFTNVVEKI